MTTPPRVCGSSLHSDSLDAPCSQARLAATPPKLKLRTRDLPGGPSAASSCLRTCVRLVSTPPNPHAKTLHDPSVGPIRFPNASMLRRPTRHAPT